MKQNSTLEFRKEKKKKPKTKKIVWDLGITSLMGLCRVFSEFVERWKGGKVFFFFVCGYVDLFFFVRRWTIFFLGLLRGSPFFFPKSIEQSTELKSMVMALVLGLALVFEWG